MELKKEYVKFVEDYLPFEWEVDKSDIKNRYYGQHSFEIGFKRFFWHPWPESLGIPMVLWPGHPRCSDRATSEK